MMTHFQTSPLSQASKQKLLRTNIRSKLLDAGYTIIPLAQGTKRPLVRWKSCLTTPPTRQAMEIWFERFRSADIAVLTTQHSGIICLDCDQPPYPPKGFYTTTPSGGRHYWYNIHEDDNHGIGVKPGKDIPWLVKIYALPLINYGRIPMRGTPASDANISAAFVDTDVPYNAYIDNCDFMKWFNIQKLLPKWDDRYFLARAYASNIANSNAPKNVRALGDNYQHEHTIYSSIRKPITCKRIVSGGFPCVYYDTVKNCCRQDAKSRSPYGLANSKRYEHNARQD